MDPLLVTFTEPAGDKWGLVPDPTTPRLLHGGLEEVKGMVVFGCLGHWSYSIGAYLYDSHSSVTEPLVGPQSFILKKNFAPIFVKSTALIPDTLHTFLYSPLQLFPLFVNVFLH